MRLRDIVSYHYEKVDHEIIFDICANHLLKLKKTISCKGYKQMRINQWKIINF
jgi:uncharacterized protein with HEPN domain